MYKANGFSVFSWFEKVEKVIKSLDIKRVL